MEGRSPVIWDKEHKLWFARPVQICHYWTDGVHDHTKSQQMQLIPSANLPRNWKKQDWY